MDTQAQSNYACLRVITDSVAIQQHLAKLKVRRKHILISAMMLNKEDWKIKLSDKIRISAHIIERKHPGQGFETVLV